MISGNAITTSRTRLQAKVEPAAEIGAADAEHHAGDAGDDRAREADDQRRARAEDDARQQVPPELIGAEPVRPARRLGHRRKIVRGRAVGGDPVGEEPGERHDDHERHAEGAERLAAAEDPGSAQDRAADLRHIVGNGGDGAGGRGGDRHDRLTGSGCAGRARRRPGRRRCWSARRRRRPASPMLGSSCSPGSARIARRAGRCRSD